MEFKKILVLFFNYNKKINFFIKGNIYFAQLKGLSDNLTFDLVD